MGSGIDEEIRDRLVIVLRVLIVLGGALPWWIPLARSSSPDATIGRMLDGAFIPFCHRLPDRSLELAGVWMPVCSRCAGMFAGFAFGAILALPRWSIRTWRVVIATATVAMITDVVTQDLGIHSVSHPLRLATGAALGYAIVAAFVAAVRFPERATSGRPSRRIR